MESVNASLKRLHTQDILGGHIGRSRGDIIAREQASIVKDITRIVPGRIERFLEYGVVDVEGETVMMATLRAPVRYESAGDALFLWAHKVRVTPDDKRGIEVVHVVCEGRVKGVLSAEVVVLGHDMVHDPGGREGALEHRRRGGIALVVHDYPGPAEGAVGRRGHTGRVRAHAGRGRMGGDDLAPVGEDGLAEEGRGGLGAVGCDVGYAGCGVDEGVVRAEVEVEGLREGGEGEAEGVGVAEDGRLGRRGQGARAQRVRRPSLAGEYLEGEGGRVREAFNGASRGRVSCRSSQDGSVVRLDGCYLQLVQGILRGERPALAGGRRRT